MPKKPKKTPKNQRHKHVTKKPNTHQMDIQRPTQLIKIILLGDAGVGKTALFSTYLQRPKTTHEYYTTIGVDFGHRITQNIKIQVWDTAGQERFRSITRSYYRGAHIIFLLFDITHAPSFASLGDWVKDVGVSANAQRYFLVGTKADQASEKREVDVNAARLFAATLDAPYFEVSTTDPASIETLFEAVVPVVQAGLYTRESMGANRLPAKNTLGSSNRCACLS
jgi:Ras-related protein Rab-1A